MSTRWSRSAAALLLATAALMLAVVPGCSGGVKKVTVNGTVSYKGKRVPSGILQFVGPEGSYSASAIQSDGTYIMTDVVPGEVKVGVQESPQSSGVDSSGKKVGGAQAASVNLPQKYRDPENSGLRYTIEPKTTELHIDIKE